MKYEAIPAALTEGTDLMSEKNVILPLRRETDGSPEGTVTVEPLDHLERYWRDQEAPLGWDCLFMLPPWLGAWSASFGHETAPHLRVVRKGGTPIGVAPLSLEGDTARLIGSSELTDYGDFIIAPGRENDFFGILVEQLRQEGLSRITMGQVRSDSETLVSLKADAAALGCRLTCEPAGVLYEMQLPDSWQAYLDLLSGKDRHEVRRKLRHLHSAGRVAVRVGEEREAVPAAMDTFIMLFRSNIREKALFMTEATEHFFRSLADRMAEARLLRLLFVDLDGTPVAATMCFDYRSAFYLYNNGYDERYSHLSLGLLSKVFTIRETIFLGRRRFNFLRGGETYKRRLGGSPIGLLECEVSLK